MSNETKNVLKVLLEDFEEPIYRAAAGLLRTEYEKSINFANENVAEVSKIVEDFEIVPEGLGEKSIPNINMQYIDGSDMQEAVSKYLEKLYEFEPKLVGGKLPDEGFYYKK